MRLRTASLFASEPAIRSSIWRTPPASCRTFMRITFPRCLMTSTSRYIFIASAAVCLVFGAGCDYLRQDMANQPKNRPLTPSSFFEDGRSERPLVENTVERGSLANDALFVPKDSNSFPLPVDLALLERGEERYKIFCSPCHGLQGDGNGMVVMRGMKRPPSYHQDRLRQAPNGYFYDNITNGFGQMMGYSAPESVGRLQQWALMIGGFALLVSILVAVRTPGLFYQSYLMSFLLILGLTVGSLGLVMLQHLTSGHWGIIIRRPLESATRTLPLIVAFFLPILFFGMKYLYGAWLNPEELEKVPLSRFQQTYLTSWRFQVRAVIYFVIWLALMLIFNGLSKRQDVNQDDRALRLRFKMLAGPGIILYVFVMSFAAIDWVMSLSPHWASTIYGFLFVAGQLISSMSLMIAVVVLLARAEPFASVLQRRHLHDLGKLLLAFVMLWAYFDFSQLLIIWSGNLPEEISFYRTRLYGEWGVVAVIVLVFHFFVPFFLLLSQDVKRNAKVLPRIAIWLIFMRLVDLFWMTRPEFTSRAVPTWLDIVLPIALGGLWLGLFAFNLKQWPLLPLGDPELAEAIEHHEH